MDNGETQIRRGGEQRVRTKVYRDFVADVTYMKGCAAVAIFRDGKRLEYFETARKGAMKSAERAMRTLWHRYCIGMAV